MGSTDCSPERSVKATLAFRLDPSLGGSDAIEVGKHHDVKRDLHDVAIFDVNGYEEKFTFDQAGFQYVRHKTAITDFKDEASLASKYYDEVADLVKRTTGASFAHCYSHLLRASKLDESSQATNKVYGPALALHVDYNYSGASEYMKTLPERPEDWERLSQHRWAIFSAWRPLNKVTRDALCVGDKRTIPDTDLVEGTTDTSAPNRKQTLGLFWVNYNPGHKYHYKQEMEREDVLLIKLYDSKLAGVARCTPHSAFNTSGDHGEARQSIETRCIVVWEDQDRT